MKRNHATGYVLRAGEVSLLAPSKEVSIEKGESIMSVMNELQQCSIHVYDHQQSVIHMEHGETVRVLYNPYQDEQEAISRLSQLMRERDIISDNDRIVTLG